MPRATAASTMAPVLGPRRQGLGELQRQPADSLFAVFDDDLVDTRLQRGSRAAEGDRAAGSGLKFKRGVFKHARQRNHPLGT
jgi:hypothetical protein